MTPEFDTHPPPSGKHISRKAIFKHALVICSLSIFLNTIGTNWIFNIFEDFMFITIRSIVIQLVGIILLLIFVKKPEDLYKYAIISIISAYGYNVFNIVYAKRYLKFHIIHLSIEKIRMHMKPIILLFCASAASTIYMNSDKTMLGFMYGNEKVGIYTTSVKVISVVTTIVVAIREVFLPKVAMNIKDVGINYKSNELIFSGIRLIYSFVIPCIFGIFVLSDCLILMISSEMYLSASVCLKILAFELLFVPINAFLAYQVLVPIHRANVVAVSTFVAEVVNIALNLIMIPLWGTNGAAITTVLAEIVVFFFLCRNIRYILNLKTLVPDIVKFSISSLIFICLGFLLPDSINPWVRTCIIILGGDVVYIFLIFKVFKIKVFECK